MATPRVILVPIVANQASLDAVTVAATVAKPRKGRVYVVHIIEVTRSLPLNAELDAEARRGEQLIRQAEEVAAHAGYPVSGTLLQAREAGSAILEEALDNAVDTIIMGVESSGNTGTVHLGRTVEHVLMNATCAVWVVRQSMIPQADHHHE
ncbi:MAG: universal stress protein [Dehalococcoidia bacterium]|nr:universal stress protein [Dehalococcoidia bacterium]